MMSRFIRPGIIRPTVVFLLVFGFPQPGTQSLAQQRQGGQSTPSGTPRSGDVFSSNGQGRGTRTTGTQGVNHGKGGNKTCQTTRNTPGYNPNTCTDVFASNGSPGRPQPKPTPKADPWPPAKKKIDWDDFPNLGKKGCVLPDRSQFWLDQFFADYRLSEYNCHYYAYVFMHGDLPRNVIGGYIKIGNGYCLNDDDFKRQGYTPVALGNDLTSPRQRAHVGDLITVVGDAGYGCRYLHTGIVTDVDTSGRIRKIRQKFDPTHCIVELTPDEFHLSYLATGTADRTAILWTNARRAGSLK